jgi:hypothetical protein
VYCTRTDKIQNLRIVKRIRKVLKEKGMPFLVFPVPRQAGSLVREVF